jgi:hypothetical protein
MENEKQRVRIKLKTKRLSVKDFSQNQNTSFQDKVKVRHHVIKSLGLTDPMILDVFAGRGEMWKTAYNKTKNYLGIEQKFLTNDPRRMVFCENTRFLRQADLDEFDLFDLDAWGLPFEQLAIICSRLEFTKRKKVGIVLTDGTGFNAKFGTMNKKFLRFLEVPGNVSNQFQFRFRDQMIFTAIEKTADLAGAKPANVLVAKKQGGGFMRYIGYTLEKL